MAAELGEKSALAERLARENAVVCVGCHRGQSRSYWLISFKPDLSHEGAGTTERPVTDQHSLTSEIHKHHPEQERISHIKKVSHAGETQAHPHNMVASQILYLLE